MGQYYYPVIDNGVEKVSLCSHKYGNGLKLMEHSYVGNEFVNAVLSCIKDNPARVAWVGDYSNGWDRKENYCKKIRVRDFIRDWYNAVYSDKSRHKAKIIRPDPMEYDENVKGLYLINHTQEIYVDMDKYNAENVENDGYMYIISPLPLLTACGNGRGGGDYFSDIGKEYIGTWSFDELEFSMMKPESYKEVTYHFSEDE